MLQLLFDFKFVEVLWMSRIQESHAQADLVSLIEETLCVLVEADVFVCEVRFQLVDTRGLNFHHTILLHW